MFNHVSFLIDIVLYDVIEYLTFNKFCRFIVLIQRYSKLPFCLLKDVFEISSCELCDFES